jgi:hypothetical protein
MTTSFPGPTLEAVGQTPATCAPVVPIRRRPLARASLATPPARASLATPLARASLATPLARASLATLLALSLALGLAAQARADAFGDTFTDYKAHGKIDPCRFSEQTLKQARGQVPPDIEQYAPDFPAELDRALQNRALGACAPPGARAASGGSPSTGAGAPTGGGPAGPTPAPPPIASASDNGVLQAAGLQGTGVSHAPLPLLVMGALALLLALPALVFYGARWRGWEPRWIVGLRYALGEAGYRAGGTWSEFADWLRLGR